MVKVAYTVAAERLKSIFASDIVDGRKSIPGENKVKRDHREIRVGACKHVHTQFWRCYVICAFYERG